MALSIHRMEGLKQDDLLQRDSVASRVRRATPSAHVPPSTIHFDHRVIHHRVLQQKHDSVCDFLRFR